MKPPLGPPRPGSVTQAIKKSMQSLRSGPASSLGLHIGHIGPGFLSSTLPARLWETSTPTLPAHTHGQPGGKARRRSSSSSLLVTRSLLTLLLLVLLGYAGGPSSMLQPQLCVLGQHSGTRIWSRGVGSKRRSGGQGSLAVGRTIGV